MKKNKLLAVLLALVMTLSLLPMTAMAEENDANQAELTDTEEPANTDSADAVDPADSVVARVGKEGYATLAKAVEAAQDGDTVTLLADAEFDWGSNSYEESGALVLSGKTIVGVTGAETVIFKGYGSANPIKNLTLKTLKVKDLTEGDNEASWEHGYLEFEELTATDVVFVDQPQFNGTCTLTNCTLTGTTDQYAAWVNSGNITFTRCEINGARSVKIHEAYGSDVETVTVDNCTFNTTKKPGVVIGTLDATTTVTIKNSTFADCPAGDQSKYIYESDTDVGTFKFASSNNRVTFAGAVAEIDGFQYLTLAEAVAAASNSENESGTIKLLKNASGDGIKIDSSKFTTGLTIDFDGHTYTVDGTTVGSSGTETQAFQLLKGGKVTFKDGIITSTTAKMLIQNYCDLTLDNMVLDGSDLIGSGTVYTLSTNNGNTVVKDSTITARATNGVAFDVCTFGSYTGNTVTIQGSSVINGDVEVSGYNDAATKLVVTDGVFNGRINLLTGADAPKAFSAEITGGTFSTDPTAYKVDGTIVRVDGDSTFTVVANSNLTSGTYLTIPSVASGYRYTGSEGAYVVSRIPSTPSNSGSSSGGSSSSSNATTTTEKNPDGSTTTTTTDKTTGAVTEVTKEKDGTTTTVETKKDGTVTETVKLSDGTTGTVVTDKSGNVTEAKAVVSSTAAKEAGKTGGAVTLPVEVPAAKATADAPAVEITVPQSAGSVKVEIPVEKVTPGSVAVIVKADGTEKIVSTSVTTESGVALTLGSNTTVKVIDNAKIFADVPVTNVFYNEICSMSAREIMVGRSEDTFDLHSSVTLNQVANVAGRIVGAVDVKDYKAGIVWGAENGLKTGNTDASRGDVLKALYMAAGSPVVEDTSILARFNDASAISADLTAAAAWATQNGILKGTTDGNANLSANVTRGQACALAGRTMGTLA